MKGKFVPFFEFSKLKFFLKFRYKVYQVTPKNEQEVDVLKHLETYELIDFWSPLRKVGGPVNIMVPPSIKNYFFEILNAANIQYTVLIENVERYD